MNVTKPIEEVIKNLDHVDMNVLLKITMQVKKLIVSRTLPRCQKI